MTPTPLAAPLLTLVTALVLRAIELAHPRLARALGGVALLAQLLLAVVAVEATASGSVFATPLSFGIHAGAILVLDGLSAWMLLVSALALFLAWATFRPAVGGARYPGTQLQLQLFGIEGACLVGDLFSLGVLLLATLLVATAASATAAGTRRPRNFLAMVIAAALSAAVAGVALATGTVDFATLAVVAPAIPSATALPLGTAAFGLLGVLLLVALALPSLAIARDRELGDSSPAPTVAVVLSLVCLYAVLRIYTLVFPCFIAGPCGASGLALPFGLAVVSGGALATLTVASSRSLVPCLVSLSLGIVMVAAGSFRADGLAAALFLILHTAITAALLFASTDLLARAPGGAVRTALGYARLLTLAAILGLPPLSGFVGVLTVLRASVPDALAVWTLLLLAPLTALIGLLRRRGAMEAPDARDRPVGARALAGVLLGVAALLLLAINADGALRITTSAARQILSRSSYIAAVAAVRAGSPDAHRTPRS